MLEDSGGANTVLTVTPTYPQARGGHLRGVQGPGRGAAEGGAAEGGPGARDGGHVTQGEEL